MFEAGLSSTSDDGSMAIIAASTFGGGTTVNWAASLQTPCYVRREWAEKHKLPFFQSGTFQRHLDEVSSRMGVSLPASQNHRNTTLLSGGHKLGFTSATVPQNAPPTHADPWCSFGCGCPPNSRKMGGTHTWLPDASRAGARFMTEFTAQSLVFSDVSKKRAIGVRGIYGPLKTPVTIKAREVVVAAGTLNTPSLLTNSGLRNSHIGANLFLHPTTMVYARFPERTNPSTGSPLTAIITSFDNLNKSGHGVRIETPIMSLATGLFLLPWAGGEQFKKDVLTYQHIDNYICIVRDKNPGRVRRDQEGKLKITYTASREEKSWMMEGIQAACKTAYVQGADKIWAPVVGFPPFLRNAGVATRVDDVLTSSGLDLDDPGVLEGRFSKWLAEVRSMGLPNPGTMWGSAHQMSSCRMSATKSDGVVDPYGRVWGTKGLSIADASILPTASGVNPMITVMATAAWVAENVVERLKRTA